MSDYAGSDGGYGGGSLGSHDGYHPHYGGGSSRGSVSNNSLSGGPSSSSLRTYGTSIGAKSGIALPSINGTRSSGGGGSISGGSSGIAGRPMPYKALAEGQDGIKSRDEIWAEVRDNCSRFLFPSDAQTVVPFAMAKLVTYAKYGPAVVDGADGVSLRLRGSQRLLMPHEEAALHKEEVRAIIVDIYMLKSNKAQGGKRANTVGANTNNATATSSSSSSGKPSSSQQKRVSMKALAMGGGGADASRGSVSGVNTSVGMGGGGNRASVSFANSTTQQHRGSTTSASSPTATAGASAGAAKSGPFANKKMLNTLVSTGTVTSSSSTTPPPAPPMRHAFAAANVKAMAVPDEAYGLEMLDQQHPMAAHVLELSREELRQILDLSESTLPLNEKDGGKLKRSTIIDHLADVVLSERDRRVFALKRSDARLEDVRTDPVLSKRKELTIYNKTAPQAYSIDCYDQPHHVQRALHRRAFQVVNIADGNNAQVAQNVRCLRDEYRIEPGTVKEGWDGYCCIRNKRYGGGPTSKHRAPDETD